jgi:hypothetical protein
MARRTDPGTRVSLRQPSAFIPLAMSLGAFAVVIAHVAAVGVARQADEGAEAHLWQLLMAGQLPVIAFFAISSLPRDPRHAVPILLGQGAAWIAAVAPVFLLRF